ncbi:ran-interacting mog1 [Pyrenophora seminiperda CCB06]|uniref:Ran-interacting mog1 n=1 Tax=Pyrenophora seminiperda CCB06 TaxID=1302712 RepID=A0A3M7M7Z1_9PLEO|nr:ran-interacting mog1 [Pyrenophora seminiperda CCB06]
MDFTNTPLYGGAITMDLPSNYADASQIRQIPDNQEVYLDNAGYSSVVVEILEYVHKSSDEEALQYHFADLVHGTGDATTVIEQASGKMKNLPTTPLLVLSFVQTPPSPNPHPNRKSPEYTYIHLILLRLKKQGEYEKPAEGQQETYLMTSSKLVRERVLETFDIKEWGLFDG